MNLAHFRAFGAAFALVLLGVFAHAVIPPPGVQGPFLGDQNANIFSIVQAITSANQVGFAPAVLPSQTVTQAGCTILAGNAPMVNLTTSAAGGAVCLPAATAGREYFLGNATGQTITVFPSATPFLVGTQDTINGGTSWASLTTGKNGQCFAPANGIWYCAAGN